MEANERAFGKMAPTRGEFAFTAQHLSQEQRALRRLVMYMQSPREKMEELRGEESLRALHFLREKMERGQLSVDAVQTLVQMTLRHEEDLESRRHRIKTGL